MTRNSRSIAKSFNAAMEEIGRAHDLNLNRYGYIYPMLKNTLFRVDANEHNC